MSSVRAWPSDGWPVTHAAATVRDGSATGTRRASAVRHGRRLQLQMAVDACSTLDCDIDIDTTDTTETTDTPHRRRRPYTPMRLR